MASSKRPHLVVIGAGVIGLQTSLSLLEAGYEVSILADQFPNDIGDDYYTSPRAGGQWRSHALPGDEQCAWDIQTLGCWKKIVAEEEQSSDRASELKSGLGLYPSYLYWDDPSSSPEILGAEAHKPENLWWANHVVNFSVLSGPFPFPNISTGVTYQSFSFNPTQYIKWLFQRLLSAGVTMIHVKLPTAKGLTHALEAATTVLLETKLQDNNQQADCQPIFINATGLGARSLVPDENVHPIRGQTLLVRGEAKGIYTHIMSSGSDRSNEQIAYVVPRKSTGLSLIGGSKQVGIWDTTEDPQLSSTILQWAKDLAPELCNAQGELDVVTVQVGLRPGRKGGTRVEKEILKGGGKGGSDLIVIHSYGHGGSGFQNSVGSAMKVVRLVDEHLGPKA